MTTAQETTSRRQIQLPKITNVTCPTPLEISLADVRITVYPTEEAVNHHVAAKLIDVFRSKCPHIVALAADSTHGNDLHANGGEGRFGGIYPRVDIHFRANPHLLSDQVLATNLDEIDPSSVIDRNLRLSGRNATESFARNIQNDLGYVLGRLGRRGNWIPLDPQNPGRYIEVLRGPVGGNSKPHRVGFFGLGAGADGAHLAYFGERKNIFPETSRIELGAAEAKRRNATHAFSLGADALWELDEIIITVKEDRKADSLLSGFKDTWPLPQTGLGWAIRNIPHKLHIIADRAAAGKLFADSELNGCMRRVDALSAITLPKRWAVIP